MNLLAKLYDDYNIPSHRLNDGAQKVKCPECQPAHDPKDNPLSVTVEPDKILFNCHHCGFQGGVIEPSLVPHARHPKPEPVTYLAKSSTFLDSYFSKRGISRKTYDAFNIFTEDNQWIGFPYNGHHGQCDNIKHRTPDKQFRQTKNGKKSLYNYDRVKDSGYVVFVEGEIDALSVF